MIVTQLSSVGSAEADDEPVGWVSRGRGYRDTGVGWGGEGREWKFKGVGWRGGGRGGMDSSERPVDVSTKSSCDKPKIYQCGWSIYKQYTICLIVKIK